MTEGTRRYTFGPTGSENPSRCPFLREAQVKFCCASEFRKMIVRGQKDENGGRCSSPSYISCPAAQQYHEDLPSESHCPFLQESLVQYCAAASVMKYVPYSSPNVSRCGNSNHRYCELFLTMQNPGSLTSHELMVPENSYDEEEEVAWVVDGIITAGWLFYTRNHMWADVDRDGHCHIGLDAFFSKVVGNLNRLTFAVAGGEHLPAVSVAANSTEFQMVFPDRIDVSSTNTCLRANPNRVCTDPYTFGWLFEGTMPVNPRDGKQADHTLLHGERARQWMQDESARMSEFVHNNLIKKRDREIPSMADGGIFVDGLLSHLTREEALLLYDEFFSLYRRRIS